MKDKLKKLSDNHVLNFIAILIFFFLPILYAIGFVIGTNTYYLFIFYLLALLVIISLVLVPIYRRTFINNIRGLKTADKCTKIILISFALFILWAIISTFFALNTSAALTDIGHRGEGLYMYFVYAIIFIGAYNIKQDKQIDIILHILIGLTIFVSIFAIIDCYILKYSIHNFGYTMATPWRNPNHQGYFYSIAIPIMAGIFLLTKKNYLQILSIISFALGNFVMVINNSFGSQLAIFITFVLFIIFSLIKFKKISFNIFVLIATYIIFNSFGTLAQIFTLSSDENIFTNFVDFFKDLYSVILSILGVNMSEDINKAGTNRWGLWQECFEIMGKSITFALFGIGINCQPIYNPSRGLQDSRPHNELLQFSSTMGIPSGIFYLTAIVTIIVKFLRNFREVSDHAFILAFGVLGYFISSLFGVTIPYTFIYYVILLGLLVSQLRVTNNIQRDLS